MKKLLLGLGVVTSVVAPVVTTIACGNNTTPSSIVMLDANQKAKLAASVLKATGITMDPDSIVGVFSRITGGVKTTITGKSIAATTKTGNVLATTKVGDVVTIVIETIVSPSSTKLIINNEHITNPTFVMKGAVLMKEAVLLMKPVK